MGKMYQYMGDHRVANSREHSAAIMVKAEMETVIGILGHAQTRKSTLRTKSACVRLVFSEKGANFQHVPIQRKITICMVLFVLVQGAVSVRITRYASATQASSVQNVAVPARSLTVPYAAIMASAYSIRKTKLMVDVNVPWDGKASFVKLKHARWGNLQTGKWNNAQAELRVSV